MWHIVLFVVALVVVGITNWVYRWRNPKCNGKLPPGSMGWPLLGETLQFFNPDKTWGVPYFIQQRMKRYGPIFKTSIVGLPVVVSTDSDLNSMVFQKEDQLFQSWYPSSMTKVLGRTNLSTLYGNLHKFVKNMVLNQFGPESLKKMFSQVEIETGRNIERWVHEGRVELKAATADMIFGFTAKKLISHDLEKSSNNLRENYDAFINGLISFPLAIPGTVFHKCLQGRKMVIKVIENMLEERNGKPNKINTDFLDFVLEELKQKDTVITKAIAVDLIFALLFASYETTSLALVVAIKLLTDNPEALKELTAEHDNIIKERANPDSRLTWEEYKSMTFTFKVINESVRLANIIPGIFRKTLTEVKFKDYTIPSGWVVMVCPPAIHLDPIKYKDPSDFNPKRWEGMDFKVASKDFMAFGGGQRFCVGADFARLQMAVALHHLVTKSRWQAVKGGDVVRTPGLLFPHGFHVHFSKKDEQNEIN